MESNGHINEIVAQMMIRKPVSEVFGAFVDPEITRHFWFSNGSNKLEKGKTVEWQWRWYNVSISVLVQEIVQDQLIVIEWDQPAKRVEFIFETIDDGKTYVIIKESGYKEEGRKLVSAMLDSVGGFTTVLDGLKAYLEHGIELNLISDKFPKGVTHA